MGTSNPGSSSGMMYEVSILYDVCGIQRHTDAGCQTHFQGVEQVNAMQKFNPRPQNNPYSNTYNPGWRNHPNFSHRNNNLMPPFANQAQVSNTKPPITHLPNKNPTLRVSENISFKLLMS